jgi:hypothetical protein
MKDKKTTESGPQDRGFGRILRGVLFYTILVAVPLVVYFVYYADTRMEQTSVRNFRALGAASDRLEEIIGNLHRIASNVPVGVAPEDLVNLRTQDDTALIEQTKAALEKKIQELNSDLRDIGKRKQDVFRAYSTRSMRQFPVNRKGEPMPPKELQNLEENEDSRKNLLNKYTRELESLQSRSGDTCEAEKPILEILDALATISQTYLKDFRAIESATDFNVRPLRLSEEIEAKVEDPPPAEDSDQPDEETLSCRRHILRSLEILLGKESDTCDIPGRTTASANDDRVTRRLVSTDHGIAVEARHCQKFSLRSSQLAAALPKDQGEIKDVLDQFGVSAIADLEGLVDSVASNVAPLFDQYFIADSSGRVLYSTTRDQFRYEGVTGAPETQRARLDFVNHIDVKELVEHSVDREGSAFSRNMEKAGLNDGQSPAGKELARYGVHSRVEPFQIADINFQAFVHPFEVEGLAPLPSAESERDSAVLFMIGIISRASINSESMQLRLSMVANALLGITVLFSSLALLWLWTAGDRLMLGFRHLPLFLATGMAVSLLYTLFALHMMARVFDDIAFNRALEQVSSNLVDDFEREFDGRMHSLALATEKMLAFGEAPARTRSQQEQTAEKSAIEQSYYCRRPEGEVWPPQERETLYPTFDLAFLMDAAGKQWQCLSYRLFDTRPISLPFRKYFRYPQERRLWYSATTGQGPEKPGFFLDRITSILDGTTETVLSARPDDLCAYLSRMTGEEACVAEDVDLRDLPSAAIIGRMHSLENTITPPHVHYAVIENETGRTIFHSVRSRSLATNFIRETGADKGLLSAIDAGASQFVKLDYHGSRIQAFVRPLIDGVPWTLITYRDHSLADTLGIMAVSITAAYMTATLVPLFLAFMLTIALWRRLYKRSWRWRHSVLSSHFVQALPRDLIRFSTLLIVLIIIVTVVRPALGGALAVAAMGGCFIILAVAGLRQLGADQAVTATLPRTEGQQDRVAAERIPVITLLVAVMITTTILPTVGWFVQLRSEINTGLTRYIQQMTKNEIVDKCERQTAFAKRYKEGAEIRNAGNPSKMDGIFEHGWAFTPGSLMITEPQAIDQSHRCDRYPGALRQLSFIGQIIDPPSREAPGADQNLLHSIGAFSDLASDLAAHNQNPAPEFNPATPAWVLDRFINSNASADHTTVRGGDSGLMVVVILGGLWLLWVVVISISDRVLGMRLRLGLLPPVTIDPLPSQWSNPGDEPLRAVVVHRTERPSDALIEQVQHAGYQSVKRARWQTDKIVWDEDLLDTSGPGGTLYVIPGFERFVVDIAARDVLLAELERLSAASACIVICSRIVPGHWLANMTDSDTGDLANVTPQQDLTSRWSQVLGPFDVRRLVSDSAEIDTRFNHAMDKYENLTLPRKDSEEVRQTMLSEARANPVLLEFAASVAGRVCTSPQVTRGSYNRIALQRFRAGAASYFYTLWAASSREERLQLLALAKGGFANPTQAATLASLANRGLIATDGIIRLRSDAFGRFIATELDHDALLHWREEGHGNIWRSIWPPIVLIVLLAVAFFVTSTPEALAPLAAILAASLGAIPVISSLMRGFRDLKRAPSED